MEVLGIIGIYVLLMALFWFGMSSDNAKILLISVGIMLAIILWVAFKKPFNWTEHKGLYIICEILSVLFVLQFPKSRASGKGYDESQRSGCRDTPLVISDCTVGEGDCFGRLNRQIIISESVQSIGANVLNECDEVESLEIPASVESIGPEFCFHCKMLRKVSFLGSCPEGLEQAFDECWHLKEITVPAAEVEKYRTAMPKYVDIISINFLKPI